MRHLFASVPLALALICAAAPSEAAPPSMQRLQITIDSTRDAPLGSNVERGRSKLTQQLMFSVVLQGDGTPMVNNPLDPDDSRRQLERAQRTQQKVQAALDRRGAPAAAAPTAADVASMQARAQQLLARCGNDRDCLMREASAMSAAQVAGGDRNVQARLQGYGAAVAACERNAAAGAARDACIANARRQAGGTSDETDRDDTVETPYLHFRGVGACRLDVTTKIDERTEGEFPDVQGMVPFTHTRQAEQRQQGDTFCPMVQVVLDTRNGRLWTHGPLGMPAPRGVTVRSEKGRAPRRSEGEVMLQWHEAADWLQRRLSNLNAAGEDQVRLPAGNGQTEVKVRWRFGPA